VAVPEALVGETVLVTGGAGFVGSHLADALVGECEVRVFDDLSSGDPRNVPAGATIREGDVRDGAALRAAMADVDVVFHEAGMVSVPGSVDAPRECMAVNVQGTVQVLEAAREQGARVVVASSAAVYGHPESVPVPETATKRPTSPYGTSKLAADHLARQYDELHDLPTVALRYFNVFGPRQTADDYSGVVSTFLERAMAGDPDRTGRSYNVGTGRATSVNELAATVRRLARTDPPIVHTDAQPGDIRHSRADLERTRRELGFAPTVDLEAGLRSLAPGT
jgi:UDP-glucose 4-epimerase